jgi:hypothetical protein
MHLTPHVRKRAADRFLFFPGNTSNWEGSYEPAGVRKEHRALGSGCGRNVTQ